MAIGSASTTVLSRLTNSRISGAIMEKPIAFMKQKIVMLEFIRPTRLENHTIVLQLGRRAMCSFLEHRLNYFSHPKIGFGNYID